MKTYPSILKQSTAPCQGFAFDKIDGSNVRAEWSRKRGCFYKFGSRTQLIDSTTPILGESVSLIQEKYQEELSRRFHDARMQKAVAFFEFFGENSFAGSHDPKDQKNVILFDVNGDRGLLYPKDFLKFTEGIETAKLLYEGPLSQEMIHSVESGSLEGMTFEGVIFKGNSGTPGLPFMTKIKNKAWIEKLKNHCKGDEALFQKLL